MTAKERKEFDKALELLGEIRSQDFITEYAWEMKELRRWIRKTEAILERNGWVKA